MRLGIGILPRPTRDSAPFRNQAQPGTRANGHRIRFAFHGWVGRGSLLTFGEYMSMPLKLATGFWILCIGLCLAAAEPDSPGKQRELLAFLQNTDELAEFHASFLKTIGNMRKSHPEVPDWFWDSMEKEVSINDYAHWWCSIFGEALTEEDLRSLNGVFSSPQKKEVYEKINQIAQSKRGDDFKQAVNELKASYGSAIVDQLIEFAKSEAFQKYAAAFSANISEQPKEVIKLLMEADRRIRERQRSSAPNKAAEPSRTSVTPPAGAGDRASGAPGSP